MAQVLEELSREKRQGIVVSLAAVVLVLVLFLTVLVTGNPIQQLGTMTWSVVYSVVVYIPVLLVCYLTLSKLRRHS